jgi:hypothetical protein
LVRPIGVTRLPIVWRFFAIEGDVIRLRGGRQCSRSVHLPERMPDRLERLARERRPDAPAAPEEREFRGAITSTLHRMGVLRDEFTTLDKRRFQEPDVSLLVPAHPLEEPLRPRLLQALPVGALVGLFLMGGIALALLRPRAQHVDSGWE